MSIYWEMVKQAVGYEVKGIYGAIRNDEMDNFRGNWEDLSDMM